MIQANPSIFNRQPPNLKEHPSIVDDDSRSLFRINYTPRSQRWHSWRLTNRDGEIYNEIILIRIDTCQGEYYFKWEDPNLATIISEGNMTAIDGLLKEDIFNYLNPTFR
jgi:hypothetical protein